MEFKLEQYFGEPARLEIANRVSKNPGGIEAVVRNLDDFLQRSHHPIPELGTPEEFKRTKDILEHNARMLYPYGEARVNAAYLHVLARRVSYLENGEAIPYAEAMQGFMALEDDAMKDYAWPVSLTSLVNSRIVRNARRAVIPKTVGVNRFEVNQVISRIHATYHGKKHTLYY